MSSLRNISYGVTTDQGKRPHQQDEWLVVHDCFHDLNNGNMEKCRTLFAVFDGHGNSNKCDIIVFFILSFFPSFSLSWYS